VPDVSEPKDPREQQLTFDLLSVSSTNIRKIKTSLDNLHLEKQKMEKGDKPKKKAGPKSKVKLRIEGDVSATLPVTSATLTSVVSSSRMITVREPPHSKLTTTTTSCKDIRLIFMLWS
jgi:Translation initiation factor eIF3 subunit